MSAERGTNMKLSSGQTFSTRICAAAVAITTVVLLGYSFARADFEETGFGARTAGMANSFVGLADDVYSVVYNPGALGRIRDREFTASYKKLYWGLTDLTDLGENFLAFTFPLTSNRNGGTIGAALWNFHAGNLYSENTCILSYGRTLKDVINYNVYAGASLRILSKQYTANIYTENAIDFLGNSFGRDPVFANGYSKTALGVDVGAFFPFNKIYTAGVMIQNINAPDTGLAEKSILPMDSKVGVCYHAAEFNVLTDVEFVNGDMNVSPGFEKFLLKKQVALRGGFELGSRSLANLTMGASYRFSGFRLDYSFQLPLEGIQGTNGTHGMSLVIFFGEAGTIEEVVEEVPDAYQNVLRLYYKKEFVRAYEKFTTLSTSAALPAKYAKSSGEFAARIRSEMEQQASKKKYTVSQKLYAKGFLSYVDKRYPECLVQWQEYLSKNAGNREIREYTARVSSLFEKDKSIKIGGYVTEGINAKPNLKRDDELGK
jgi:hypothetical protein